MLHAVNTLSMACMVEPILWFLALFSYSRFVSRSHVPWFRYYLAIQLAVSAFSVPLLFWILRSNGANPRLLLQVYLQLYWWGAMLAGIFAIATIRNILKRLLASLVGIQRVALIAFQWLLVAVFFVVLDWMLAHSANAKLDQELAIVSYGLNICELILLSLLLPFTFILRRSLRSHFQDLMMGLAILAISNVVLGIVFHESGVLGSGAVAVAGHVILVATLAFWVSCFATEEKSEAPRMLSIDSKWVRWSERLRILDRASTGQWH